MKITHLHATRVRIPQKPPIAPYQNRYKAGTHKEALLIRLETDGGLKGGKARAAKMTPEQRADMARRAAKARWGNKS